MSSSFHPALTFLYPALRKAEESDRKAMAVAKELAETLCMELYVEKEGLFITSNLSFYCVDPSLGIYINASASLPNKMSLDCASRPSKCRSTGWINCVVKNKCSGHIHGFSMTATAYSDDQLVSIFDSWLLYTPAIFHPIQLNYIAIFRIIPSFYLPSFKSWCSTLSVTFAVRLFTECLTLY